MITPIKIKITQIKEKTDNVCALRDFNALCLMSLHLCNLRHLWIMICFGVRRIAYRAASTLLMPSAMARHSEAEKLALMPNMIARER